MTSPDKSVTQSPLEHVRESMKQAQETYDRAFGTLTSASSQLDDVGPATADIRKTIDALQQESQEEMKQQTKDIEEIKDSIREGLFNKASEAMSICIEEQVREELVKQTKEQIDVQIKDFIPVSLQDQLRENKKQMVKLESSLTNSEARRANASLSEKQQDEQLQVILREDSTKSDLYPADFRSLFSYQPQEVCQLLDDYGLSRDEIHEKNINRFLAHIGVHSFELLPLPVPSRKGPTKP